MSTTAIISLLQILRMFPFCKVLEPAEVRAVKVYYEIAKSHKAIASKHPMWRKMQIYCKIKESNIWSRAYKGVFCIFLRMRCLEAIVLYDFATPWQNFTAHKSVGSRSLQNGSIQCYSLRDGNSCSGTHFCLSDTPDTFPCMFDNAALRQNHFSETSVNAMIYVFDWSVCAVRSLTS